MWFFGNSVARVHYFAAIALLNGVSMLGIDQQIALCGKGGEWHGRRPGQGLSCLGPCTCSADITGLGRLVFVWQQRMYHTNDELIAAMHGRQPRNGTIRIQRGDAVLVNMGLDDIVSLAKYASGKRRIRGGSAPTLAQYLARWQQALATEAPRLADAMSVAQNSGRAAFWRTSTPVCHEPTFRTHWGFLTGPRRHLPVPQRSSEVAASDPFNWTTVNDLLAHSDASVVEQLHARDVPVVDMAQIDRSVVPTLSGPSSVRVTTLCRQPLSLTHPRAAARFACRCSAYKGDHTNLHPDPRLAFEQVKQMFLQMSASCMKRGMQLASHNK